ncbi:hypothetical protein BDZ90DRAFT_225274 [Jaminaea rosea]|uniref:Cell morphogenesis protein N-terminal domain-containing protein n=1 Tax=Jaminaea rosea TaxID=1569628 RepID=A0A316UYU1_9BASI|nr:hypothetical protein BDZ90DRAFT_225274 [Jaminaea rosea]PWN30459.1 hypothetical protein BDZ90DRAFT_225274 [Jaminaea rosea]
MASSSRLISILLAALVAAVCVSVANGQSSVSSTSSPLSSSAGSSSSSASSSSSSLPDTTLAPQTFSFQSIGPVGPGSVATVINGTSTTVAINTSSSVNSSTISSSSTSLNLSTVSLGLVTTRASDADPSATRMGGGSSNAAIAAARFLRTSSFEGLAGVTAASLLLVLAGAVLLSASLRCTARGLPNDPLLIRVVSPPMLIIFHRLALSLLDAGGSCMSGVAPFRETIFSLAYLGEVTPLSRSMDGGQIAIPDLDDEYFDLPNPPFASGGGAGSNGGGGGGGGGGGAGSGSESVRTGSFDDLRGPSRPWLTHGRSGSGTSADSGESSSINQQQRKEGGPGGWSFPRKGSFASLKAAFKGQGGGGGGAAAGGPGTHATSLSGPPDSGHPTTSHRPFARTTSSNNAISATPTRRKGGHQRNDSELSSGPSRTPAAPLPSARSHHAQQSSFFSEYSAGHASSSGSQQLHNMPPLPPFPPEHYNNPMPPILSNEESAFPSSYPTAPDETAAGYFDGFDTGGPSQAMAWQGTDAMLYGGRSSNWPGAALDAGPSGVAQAADLPTGIGCVDPQSPSDYALNVLMSRFLSRTQVKIQAVLDHGLEAEPLLEPSFGPGVDDEFDTLLGSLAHVSRNSLKMVLESLINWHTMHLDANVGAETVRRAMSEAAHLYGNTAATAAGSNGPPGVREVAATLMRRKALATTYLLSRSLSEVAKQMQLGEAGAAADAEVNTLFSTIFELLQNCSRSRVPRSSMQSQAFESVSELLGELSRKYFMGIGDRFVSMLEHCAKVPPSKNVELAQETAVQGMRHLTITVFPMEHFEEGAEFLETISRFFVGAHGQRVKTAYAETLTHLILPVAKAASAEVNHPTWAKVMETIAPRAATMAAKPRYWSVAFSLYVAALCASPEEQFLQGIAGNWGWIACVDVAVSRSKDRPSRPIVMNTALRLIWVYMFRCHESSNTTTKRLDSFYRQWFPAGRSTVLPSESVLAPHIHMVHLVLYRHFDYGRDLVLDFLRHSVLSGSTLSLQPEIITSQRMIIAIRAILLTLEAYVKTESPPFPIADTMTTALDAVGDELPPDFTFPRPDTADAQAKFNDLIGKIALICDHQVGTSTVFDESVIVMRTHNVAQNGSLIDHERNLIRSHPRSKLSVAYARDQQPYMDLLRACFDSWPRCLSSSIPFASVLSCLFKAHWSGDPQLGEAASQALRRIARQRKGGAGAVVSGFGRHIFRAESLFWETHPHQIALLPKVEAALRLWTEFLNIWLGQLRASKTDEQSGVDAKMERTSAWAITDEVEAYGLLLLCSGYRHLRRQAISILRLVAVLDEAFQTPGSGGRPPSAAEPARIIHLLDLPCREFCNVDDPQLSAEQRQRVQEWTRSNSNHPLSDLAESDFVIEHSLWQHVLPGLLRMCLDHFPTTVAVFRSHVTNRVLSMDAAVATAAGLVPRAATTMGAGGGSTTKTMPTSSSLSGGLASAPQGGGSAADQTLMAEHWKFYILALCTSTTSTEGSRGAVSHRRQGSDPSSGERVIAARDLFQKLVPFLASDQVKFRDAVVVALGNINVNLYRTLLETLQAVSSQLVESRVATGRGGAQPPRRHGRLRTALGHVVQLTSSHMTEQALSEEAVVSLLLNWIKDTFNLLSEHRDVQSFWDLQRLRRFFCGVVESLYSRMWPRGGCDRYFPFETRHKMFALFAEWYSYSQSAKDGPGKLAALLANVAEQLRDDKQRESVLASLREDTQSLSFHASDAMATLCQGPIATPDVPSPYTSPWLIEWLEGLFRSPVPTNHGIARRALRSLLINNGADANLLAAVIDSAFHEADNLASPRSIFACFCDTAVDRSVPLQARIEVPLHHILVLTLTKLGHSDVAIRRKALALIEWASRREAPSLSLHHVDVGVSSPLPATYLRAQRDISAFLAHHFGTHKVAFVCEATARLSDIDSSRRSTTLGLLPDWLRDIDLLQGADSAGGGNEITYCSLLVLSNLLSLTVKYGDEHNFEIQDAWASLAEGSQVFFNSNAIVKFLVEQGLCYRSAAFVIHAKRVVSCLSQTIIGPPMFDELCAFIEPTSVIPVPRDQVNVQPSAPAHRSLFRANLDILLPLSSKQQVFSPGQLALIFIGELTYEPSDQLNAKLPTLLHAIFVQIDSVIPFVQEQAVATFEQLLRSLASMKAAAMGGEAVATAKEQVEQLFSKGAANFWSHMDLEVTLDEFKTPRKMRYLLSETLRILQPLSPGLGEQWATVALYWATSGPVRHIACRSFQAFRILLPPATPTMLADLLGRLSNTISDPNIDIQSFSLEILSTLTALIKSTDRHRQDIFAQAFWAAVACLSTANEREFGVALEMLDGLLDKVDLGDTETINLLRSKCPEGWDGDVGGIQPLVLRGLRSSATSAASFKVLMRVAKIHNSDLVDASPDRIAFLLVSALPWFLQASDATVKDPAVLELAEDIAVLCEAEGRADIARVATSIARSRFRTKDDMTRQAVNSIRTHYLPRLGPQLAVNLLGLTLNQHEWLRSNTMQVLKIFFQAIDTRSPAFASLGSELLMPLLRLLSTPLAAQALEVLDEPITIHGGPTANQILRMSLQWGRPNRRREQGSDASIFGTPDDSGWAVANPQELTSRTRINIQAVFKTCELTLDVSPLSIVDFVNEDDFYAAGGDQSIGGGSVGGVTVGGVDANGEPFAAGGGGDNLASLGDIVSQLHDLSAFFTDEDGGGETGSPSTPGANNGARRLASGAGSMANGSLYALQSGQHLGHHAHAGEGSSSSISIPGEVSAHGLAINGNGSARPYDIDEDPDSEYEEDEEDDEELAGTMETLASSGGAWSSNETPRADPMSHRNGHGGSHAPNGSMVASSRTRQRPLLPGSVSTDAFPMDYSTDDTPSLASSSTWTTGGGLTGAIRGRGVPMEDAGQRSTVDDEASYGSNGSGYSPAGRVGGSSTPGGSNKRRSFFYRKGYA